MIKQLVLNSGDWRNWLARTHGVREATSSNLVSPTNRLWQNLIMLPFGHSSLSYLIGRVPQKKNRLSWVELVFVIFCGNVFDFDYLLPSVLGLPPGSHHYLPTHTPAFGIGLLIIFFILLRRYFKPTTFLCAFGAMMSHFVGDDLSYWFGIWGLGGWVKPQIFWLYPFDPRRSVELNKMIDTYQVQPWGTINVLNIYLNYRPLLFYVEIVVVTITVLAFVKFDLKNLINDWNKSIMKRPSLRKQLTWSSGMIKSFS